MSVLMRGVNMPKNCEECNFKGECRNFWYKIREGYTRPSWCPLEEVADTPQEDEREKCMTLRQNIVGILETCFAGFKDEMIEMCADRIMVQIERQADELQTVRSK